MITIRTQNRRTYIEGNTYPHRAALRAAGCHWDRDAGAWWLGDAGKAAQLVERLSAAAAPKPADEASAPGEAAPGEDAVVAGRGVYKDRTYYLAGRTLRGRSYYDGDKVQMVATRDGAKLLLLSRDGSRQFWAPREMVQVSKRYDRPQTIAGLRRFAAAAKKGFPGRATCYMCGSPSCDGARGGLCEHD